MYNELFKSNILLLLTYYIYIYRKEGKLGLKYLYNIRIAGVKEVFFKTLLNSKDTL